MTPDELPHAEDPASDDDVGGTSRDAHAGTPDGALPEPHEALPPLLPFYTPSRAERPLPRGCHPLVIGVVLATVQFAATCYFMPSCFHPQG